MTKVLIGAALLGLAVTVAGCAKYDSKKAPAATSTTDQKATTPTTHKAMKPVTPSEAQKPGIGKPEAKQPAAKPAAGAETPKESK